MPIDERIVYSLLTLVISSLIAIWFCVVYIALFGFTSIAEIAVVGIIITAVSWLYFLLNANKIISYIDNANH